MTSGIFHVVIFVIAAVGLPFVAKKPLMISTPINIEIIQIDKKTQTNKPKPPQKAPDKMEKPKPPESKPKAAPKMTSEKPPDLSKPAPPKIEKMVQKPKPRPKPPQAKPKAPNKPKNDMATLLKNLIGEENPTPKEPEEKPENAAAQAQMASLADRLTISELDAFKNQLAPCWNIPIGGKYAEDLVVEIRMLVNPDMTLQSASILNQTRYTLDSHFRAAADSAMRALRNPRCSPYKLPTDKYEQWKVMTIQFDPREMLQ